jgi:aminopeptidase N
MENAGAITFNDTYILLNEDAPLQQVRSYAYITAHEIAHHWFGNFVTPEWWDDIWLNEGFATWMMSKPVKVWRPDWHVEPDEVQANHRAMGLDALRSTRSIRAKASTTAEIAELFDPIAYEKGAAVLRMVEAWVGEEPFRAAVNAYIERFQYGNARAEDFWTTLTKVTGKPVDRVMQTFVDQPGMPLITIASKPCAPARRGAGKILLSVDLAQERYSREPLPKTAGPPQLWEVPVCVRTSTGLTHCEIVNEQRSGIEIQACPTCPSEHTCPDWVMGNAGARGYYRSAVSPDALRRMAAEVARLTPSERMTVLSDEWALVRASKHDVAAMMDLVSGFRAERSADVLRTLTTILEVIDQTLVTDATRPRFRAWVAALLSPALAEIGTAGRPGDTDETRALRATLFRALGRTARSQEVLAAARELVERGLRERGSVDATLLTVAVDLAAIEGDATLYDQYLSRSKAAVDPEERYTYLYALTSFADPALVRRTMQLALSDDVRSQDAKIVVAQMLGNPDTRELAWDLLPARWPELQEKTGEFVGNTMVVAPLGTFCDARTADEIEQFFGANKVPDAERTLRQSIEGVRACARLAAAQRPTLAAWLAAH